MMSTNKPSVVVFDLGKVLVDFDYMIAARRIAARANISLADLGKFFVSSPLMLHYETGLITSNELYQQVCAGTGFAGDYEEFGSFFADIFSEIPAMIKLHADLRAQGVPTFIFSNTNDLAIRHIRRNFPFFSNFEGYVLSYEHHAMKPDPKTYQAVEQLAGRRGPEILYLDDRPENIAGAAARGWRTIVHETPEKSLAAVREAGLLDGVAK